MTLKDNIGLIKQYAFVSVTNYSTVGTGESVSAAMRDYENKLRSDGVTTIGKLGGVVEQLEAPSCASRASTAAATPFTSSCFRKNRTSCLLQNPPPVQSLHSPSQT